MTTTRINHTGHNHPSTTAARTACRKAMKTTAPAPAPRGSLDLAAIGNGTRLHYIDVAVGTTRCGKADPVFVRTGEIAEVDCRSCRAKHGQAHG